MSLQTAGKMLLKNLGPSTEEEARQAIMESRRRGAVEEPEPRSTFDRPSWEQFKLKMEDELSAHPDRDDARSALDLAIRHLEWLAKLAKKSGLNSVLCPKPSSPCPNPQGFAFVVSAGLRRRCRLGSCVRRMPASTVPPRGRIPP